MVATERTSRAEKTKQLFAMIWYDASLLSLNFHGVVSLTIDDLQAQDCL